MEIEEILNDPDSFIEILKAYKKEREKNQALMEQVAVQAQQIAELQPKASYYDVILACEDALPTAQIAKDYGWLAQTMNSFLEEQGVLFRQGQIWLPYQMYVATRYVDVRSDVYRGGDGAAHSKVYTYWTQKGRLLIYSLMKAAGFLPLMEKGE